MNTSVLELFSIGIGPSSSHAVGPMRAARQFLCSLDDTLPSITRITITLYGSLAFTCEGHGTANALLMGLEGEQPATVDPDSIATRVTAIADTKTIQLMGQHTIHFDPKADLICNMTTRLPYYANGIRFTAERSGHDPVETDYYSIGGGFIMTREDIESPLSQPTQPVPFPFESFADLAAHCTAQNASIADIIMANERSWRSDQDTAAELCHIADVMANCIARGIATRGILAGGLNVKRRAPDLYQHLLADGPPSPMHPKIMNWLNVYAMAVNEENAAGQRVVTAPTNGAAGIIPSVLQFYRAHYGCFEPHRITEFMLTAGAIGLLYKRNAAISGAEMGCQGEVGVACSMAAAGLASVLNGTLAQIENAAEIAMEHNLGLTCDPVAGLVQIPCIERNAMGAVKAVNAAKLALAESGEHKVSLDMVIKTMREVGRNMNSIYKETSEGGLAVNVTEC